MVHGEWAEVVGAQPLVLFCIVVGGLLAESVWLSELQ